MKTLSVQVHDEFYYDVQSLADYYDTTMTAVLRLYLQEAHGMTIPHDFPDEYQRPTAPELRRQGEI
jgi:hypothetical protein